MRRCNRRARDRGSAARAEVSYRNLPCKSTCCRRAAAYHTGAAVYGDFFAPKQHARRRGTLKGSSRSLAARSTTLRLTRRHARRRHTLDGDTLDGCMLDGALRRCARRRHDRRRHLCTEEPGTSSPQQLLRAKSPHARRRCAQRRHTLDGGTLDGCMLDGALLGALRRCARRRHGRSTAALQRHIMTGNAFAWNRRTLAGGALVGGTLVGGTLDGSMLDGALRRRARRWHAQWRHAQRCSVSPSYAPHRRHSHAAMITQGASSDFCVPFGCRLSCTSRRIYFRVASPAVTSIGIIFSMSTAHVQAGRSHTAHTSCTVRRPSTSTLKRTPQVSICLQLHT